MQVSHSTAATHIHYTSVVCVYTAHARASASLPRVGLRLYLACFTPVAPVASLSEEVGQDHVNRSEFQLSRHGM